MAAAYLWTLFLGMLVMVSGTMGAALRKPVDVAFGRNYVPTWAFDHIKYFNGGNEIQLHLDKYTGVCVFFIFLFTVRWHILLTITGLIWQRYWFSIKRFILIWPFQYANEVGSW
jgi:hypothetical protein